MQAFNNQENVLFFPSSIVWNFPFINRYHNWFYGYKPISKITIWKNKERLIYIYK